MSNASWAREGAFGDGDLRNLALPDEWVAAIQSSPQFRGTNLSSGWREFPTRREADDAAAVAFARLPADVQAAILAGATA